MPAPPLPLVREGMWIQVRGRCQVRACLGRQCPMCTWWLTALQLHHPCPPHSQPRSQWQLLAAAVLQAKGVGPRALQPLSHSGVPHPERLFSCTPKWVSEDERAGAAVPKHHSTEQACCSHRGLSREPGLAPLGRKTDTWTRVRPRHLTAAALVEARLPRRKGAWARTRFVAIRAQDEVGPGAQWPALPRPVGRSPSGSRCVTRHWAAQSPSGSFSTAQPSAPAWE